MSERTTVARGTSQELKDSIGGDLIAVEVAPAQIDATVTALDGLVGQAATPEERDGHRTGVVTLGAGREGAALLSDLVRRLDGAGVPILSLELRRPSLDDVFLSLTGRPTETAADPGAGTGKTDAKPSAREKQGASA